MYITGVLFGNVSLQTLAAAVLGLSHLDVVLRHQSNFSSGVLRFDPATTNILQAKQLLHLHFVL